MSSTYAHFIGVGGVGMSGIALVLHEQGAAVTGSDLKASRYSSQLSAAGIPIFIGHDAGNLGDPEIVVVSSAIRETNPELAEARRRGIEVWPRARMLAHLAGARQTIAIAGTHGKTTTSSMIATMLDRMGESPTFLIGGEVHGYGTNAVCGTGPYYVVEADESDGSFTYLDPHVALITNIEADHLDHYGTLERIEGTFAEFMSSVHEDGALIVCGDDARAVEIARTTGRRVVTYGMAEGCDVGLSITDRSGEGLRFSVTVPDAGTVECTTALPGRHMALNACGSIACAWFLGLDVSRAAEALSTFAGVRRRFDHVGTASGVTVVDDYAHHPTEVDATLTAASELGYARVWALFQPHRYSRTEALAADFGTAFGSADRVVLMDVYSAGEAPIPGVSGKTVVDAVLRTSPRARVAWLPHRADIVPFIVSQAGPGDLVMTMGAGDVTSLGPEIVRALEARAAGEAS